MGIEWLFGRRKTDAELIAEQRKALEDIRRVLERNARKAQARAAKADVAASNNVELGNMAAARQYKRDSERSRRHVLAYQKQAADIEEVLAATTLQEGAVGMQQALVRIGRVMHRSQMLLPGMQFERIMAQYTQDTAALQMKQESGVGAVGDAFEEMEQDSGEEDKDTDARVEAFMQEAADKMMDEAPTLPAAAGRNGKFAGKGKEKESQVGGGGYKK